MKEMVKNDFTHMQQVTTFHRLAALFTNNHIDDIGLGVLCLCLVLICST